MAMMYIYPLLYIIKIKNYITILSKTMDRDTFKFNEHFIDKSEEILKWKHPSQQTMLNKFGSTLFQL